jgi:hypothetical protein
MVRREMSAAIAASKEESEKKVREEKEREGQGWKLKCQQLQMKLEVSEEIRAITQRENQQLTQLCDQFLSLMSGTQQ